MHKSDSRKSESRDKDESKSDNDSGIDSETGLWRYLTKTVKQEIGKLT